MELQQELEKVMGMTEQQVMEAYNADNKQDIIDLIQDDMNQCSDPEEYDYTDRELEEERSSLCRIQGLSRFC